MVRLHGGEHAKSRDHPITDGTIEKSPFRVWVETQTVPKTVLKTPAMMGLTPPLWLWYRASIAITINLVTGGTIMNPWAKSLIIVVCGTALMAGAGSVVLGQDNLVRAKVGIQVKSGQSLARAKASETIKAGDMLRIFVQPEADAWVYVVHTDAATASLLNLVRQQRQAVTIVMPSLQEFYQVDGKSPSETFTIVCSPGEIVEMAELVQKGSIDHKAWAAIENKLAQQGKIELATQGEKPFALAGNVRGAGPGAGEDPFAASLPIFSGNGVLVKKYAFAVKN